MPTADLQFALTLTWAQRCALLPTLRLWRQQIFSSEIRFVPFGPGRRRKFNGSHTRNARFSVVYGRASAQFRCRLNSSLPSANSHSIPPNVRGRQPVTPTDGAGAVPAGGGSSLPLPGGPGIDPAGITTGARGASLKRDRGVMLRAASREARPGSSFGTWPEQAPRWSAERRARCAQRAPHPTMRPIHLRLSALCLPLFFGGEHCLFFGGKQFLPFVAKARMRMHRENERAFHLSLQEAAQRPREG